VGRVVAAPNPNSPSRRRWPCRRPKAPHTGSPRAHHSGDADAGRARGLAPRPGVLDCRRDAPDAMPGPPLRYV